mmetsp:Transcript_94983/g.295702  ORF Transcript_94983/g.295702 Transcript_94983/m.295702 type:complete len:89 (-) Transcript_94983:60-326(-)
MMHRPVMSVECYSALSGFWGQMPSLPLHHAFTSMVALGGYLYVLGGVSGLDVTASVERLDLMSETWESLPPMPDVLIGRSFAALPPQD